MTVETLETLGAEKMSEQSIKDFLASHGVGVVAFPTDDVPYVLPLSFGYDGERRLYFTYVTGDTSRKANLSRDDTRASVLVYTAETPFNWRSVICEGTVREVPKSEWNVHEEAMNDNAWHRSYFQQCSAVTRWNWVYSRVVGPHPSLPSAFDSDRTTAGAMTADPPPTVALACSGL